MLLATPEPSPQLLTPQDHALLMFDSQSQMAFATHSIDGVNLRNNAALVAIAAAAFKVSTIFTTVAEKSFSGPKWRLWPGHHLCQDHVRRARRLTSSS